MDNDFQLSVVERDGAQVLQVSGEVDLGRGPALKEALLLLASTHLPTVIVDLTMVTFIDSTGLSALMLAERQFRRLDRDMRIVITAPAVQKAFQVTALDEVFAVYDSLPAALASTGQPPASPAQLASSTDETGAVVEVRERQPADCI